MQYISRIQYWAGMLYPLFCRKKMRIFFKELGTINDPCVITGIAIKRKRADWSIGDGPFQRLLFGWESNTFIQLGNKLVQSVVQSLDGFVYSITFGIDNLFQTRNILNQWRRICSELVKFFDSFFLKSKCGGINMTASCLNECFSGISKFVLFWWISWRRRRHSCL